MIEPPKEIPITKPPVTVGAFGDEIRPVPKLERAPEVASVNFDTDAKRQTAARATVADAGFGPSTPGPASARTALTTANAGFSTDMTPKPAATAPRTTSAAGFGQDMTARPAPAPPKPPAQAAGFVADPPVVTRPAPQAPPPRADRPVEVVYKPTPNYTDDARAQHIEGEVMLEVEFTAAGQVRVLRVVRGLGHGLDEMAQRAAEQIRFKPATSKGTPVDFRANLTILFRLT